MSSKISLDLFSKILGWLHILRLNQYHVFYHANILKYYNNNSYIPLNKLMKIVLLKKFKTVLIFNECFGDNNK